MTDGGEMHTSDITRRLRHNSPAATRKWILRAGLAAKRRDTKTGEKLYAVADVEQAIAAMPRGGYKIREHPDA